MARNGTGSTRKEYRYSSSDIISRVIECVVREVMGSVGVRARWIRDSRGVLLGGGQGHEDSRLSRVVRASG